MKAGPARKRRAVVEEIEPRILYSADFAPGLVDAATFTTTAEQRTVDSAGEYSQTSTQDAQTRRHELVLVETNTPDYQRLVDDIVKQAGDGRDVEVVLLDASKDGIQQITDALAGRKDLSAVHLISHGADGQVQLGTTSLNFDTLLRNAAEIKGWSKAFTADGDLLIYGCDVAQHQDGKSLIDALARLTGADVAASEDVTGAASKGGNWTLEYHEGAVQAQIIFNQSTLDDWDGALQATAQGGETLANTATGNTQDATTTGLPRAVATDANGNFVVVWASNAAGAQGDGSGYGIYAQRFTAAGAKVGSEFRVNNYTTSDQTQPSIAMDANGNFVVAWTSNGQDGDVLGVYAQRFNASATKVGGEFRVNSTTASDQFTPIVAMNATGNFVVMWTSSGQDGSGYGIFAKRYNASGVAQSGDLQINSNATGDQWPDGLVVDAGGNFIATFASSDPGGWGVYSARYDLGLNVVLPEVRVNTTTAGDQDNGAIAMDSSGNYVVAWRSAGQDGSGTGIYAQRYNASGTKIGGEIAVNTTTAGDQTRPEIAMDAGGRFVVTWSSYGQDAAGTWGVYQQEFYPNGTKNGGEVRVSGTTGGNQQNASVSMTAQGDFVVVWSGNGAGDPDGVFFQRYISPGVTISQTSGLTTTEAGGTASFTVVLDRAPTSNVTIALASSDTTEGTVSASSLTFTTANWNTAQTVTVTGVDDAFSDGSIAYTILTGAAVSADANYNGLTVADVSVTNSDTTPSEPARTINEDGSQVFSAAGGNAVNVTDGTTTDSTLRVQMTVTNGIFTLSQTTGLTFISGANGTSTMTVQGLESNINAALNGSVYAPTANYNGSANLQVTTTRVPDVTAQYTFENAGSLGTDATGTYNGTLGGSGTTGVVDATRGNVASLTGAGYVQSTGHFGNPASMTLGAWVNLTAADTGGAEVISLGDSAGIRLDDSVGGVTGFMYNGTAWQNTRSSRFVAGTGWHYVAYTFDNTSKLATLYLDGTVVASATLTGSITYNQGANSFIGKHGNGGTIHDFNGRIDDVRVYNRALSATEIAALAADAKAPTQSVAITVTAVNDAPTRAAAGVSLAAVAEDTANPAGATVSSLFTSAFSDATDQVSGGSSANTLAGVAVTANAANSGTEGRWQWYNGSSWVDISTSASTSSALVLASGTSVRFLPNADYNGTPGSLTVRLIDNSAGAVTSGSTVNVTTSGGTTQYSDAANAVTLGTSVTAANDAPVLTGANNLTAIGEDPASNAGTLVSALIAGKVSDADSGALSGIAVTAVDNTNGAWQYSTNGGTTWTAFGTPSGGVARLLAADANTYVRFVPNANWNGTVSPGITFRAWDQTSGAAGGTANTGTNGGSSAFSSTLASAAVTVTAVNDAPTRTGASVSLAAVAEDTANPAGATVSSLFTSVFSDATDQVTGGSAANTLAGVAVTANAANSGTEGRWQWYNGSAWVDISTSVSGSSALVLATGTSVRFLPNADYNGTPGSLSVRLIDNSAGAVTSGTTVNVTTSGGTTQYSDAANAVTLGTSVTTANDAPVLTGANNLTAIGEDPSSNTGTLVSALISSKVSDVDSGALTGIGVTAVDNSNGAWQYSTNGGTTWTAFGTPTAASARLLAADANTYVRFVPNANWNGTVTPGITFRAWDQTSGTAGNTADTSTNGGSSAFSSATASASIIVNAVNDAPTRTAASVSLAAVAEDTANPAGATVSSLFTAAFSDAIDQITGGSAANTLAGVAVTANAANSGTEGRWQWYNGSAWVDISTSVSNSSALVLASGTSVRFLPNGDYNGTPGSLSVRLIDNSSGAVTSGTTVNVTTSGGTTQYSDAANPVTLATSVTAANDAPVLTGANNLTAVSEDPGSNTGTLVSALIAGKVSDVDSAAQSGIAVTAVDNANGSWQYSTNGGTTWNTFGTPTAAITRLLAADANSYVRFVPNADWNGTVAPGITFRAWDQTSGTAGSTADTSSNGGTTAFSNATASATITVNAVNDAPTNTVPAAQGTTQNTALVFSSANGNQISIADVDAGGSSVQVTLTATNGTITLNGLGGLAFTTGDGTTDATMTFTGTLASINTALNGLSFNPTTGFSGPASLAITTDDQGNTGSGGAKSANSTVNITVNAALAPTASNDAFTVNEDNTLNVGGAGVLQNDSAPSMQPMSAVLVGGPSHASAFTLNADGTFTYTPVANFAGIDTFTYRANDGTSNSNLATATITVSPVNDAPTGANNTVVVLEDGTYTFAAGDFGFTDSNDSPANTLTAVIVGTLPGTGSLTNNGVAVSAGQAVTLADIMAGNLEYTPAADASGVGYASFTFQVRDDGGTVNGGVDTDAIARTMTVTVTPVNDAPVLTGANNLTAIDEDPVANPGTLVSALIAGQVGDVDAAPLSGIAVTAVDNTNGTWQYSTDTGGTWTAFGSPGAANARLLAADANTYVRFVPNANWNGAVPNGITFRAWDQTSGTAGSTADTSSNGGTTAFSSATASAGVTVNAVNDAPVIVSVPASYAATEQTPLDLAGSISITDVDAGAGSIQTTLSVVSGTLTATPGILSVTITGSGTNSLTLTGTLTNVFNLLQGNGGATLSYLISSDAPPATDTLTVLVDDQGNTGLGGAKTTSANVTINISAVNDAPTLSNGASVSLSGTTEDTTSSGTTINAVLIGASWADVDSAPAKGIAVTAVTGNGTWQYSTDGSTWTNFGAVSGSSALLLDSASQVRYMPDGLNGETATFSFRAWDKTSGTASVNGSPSTADPGAGGGSSAYSTESASAALVVSSVNDAPVLDSSGAMTLAGVDEDDVSNSGDTVSAIIASAGGDRITDVDSGAVEGIAVTALVSGNGTWEYSTDGGASWNNTGAVSNMSALLLGATDRLRFVPDGLNADVASVSFRAWDQTNGTAGSKVDVSSNGNATAFSSAIGTAGITVTAVNDAPVLADTAVTLNAVNEDAGAPVGAVGTLVSTLVGGVSDVDSAALQGIAIIAADTTNGGWFYSTDNGANWNALGSPNAASSQLLAADAGTRVYFQPNADYNGTLTTGITFRAWDRTSGVNGGTADTTTNGGTSAFSAASDMASLTVNPVNDAPTGAVVITGTAAEDQTLTADVSSIADVDGLGAFSYQWARSTDGGATWSNVGGATASTYTLGDADVDAMVRVSVSYTDGDATAESLTSANVGPVANVNDAPVGAVTITGTVTEDQTLTADTSTIADADGLGAFSYQWARSTDGGTTWSDIAGATASTYMLGDADVEALIQVRVDYTDGWGTAESLTSSSVGPVTNVNDAPTGAVAITGSVTEDQTLTADTGTIADADGLGTFSYQWARSTDGGTTWSSIAGATAASYTLGDADVNALIQVSVSYTDGWGAAESLTSAAAGPVVNVNDAPTGAVTITGTATEDQTLTADPSGITDIDGLGTFTYQWARSTDGGSTWSTIGGAIASTYTLGDADVGNLIHVSVSYTDGHGTAESLTSANVGPVVNVNDAPGGAVLITGSVTEDQTLTADTSGIADADGLGAFGYQWARSTDGGTTWNAIAGATASTYTLGDADVGNRIRVTVGYTDGHGTAESLTSAAAGPVANVNDAPTGSVVISGTLTEDQTLTADASSIADVDGLGAFSYQWARSTDGGTTWNAVAGATAGTYTLGDADAGNLIRVSVGYTDGWGTAETVTSANAGPVANINDVPTGAVAITGTATEDQTLSADTGAIADADGLGAFSYQWARSTDGGTTWSSIGGATASTHTLGDADVNALIRVSVSYTDAHATAESLISATVGPVANVNDAPAGAVVITGSVTEDQILTADTSSIADADGLGAFGYQWARSIDGGTTWSTIGGAMASTYTLGDADVGNLVRVSVGYTDGHGTAESLTSASAGPVANVNDAPTGAVGISGTPTEDQTLTADTSSIADVDGLGVLSYQWARSTDGGTTWNNIGGATASNYTLVDADVNALVRVGVSYTDGHGTAESLTSTGAGPVANVNDAPTGALTITGTVTEDQVLSADTSSIADADGLGVFSYQWARSTDAGATWSSIGGATTSTYTLGDADVGNLIRVSVSYTDGHGTAESLTSANAGPVANVNDAPTGSVMITGTATEDQILSADTSSIADADGLGAFSYQWARSTDGGTTWSSIGGATASTYTLGDADVSALIQVSVSYNDGQGAAESVASASAGPVANVNDAPTGAVTITGTVTEDQTLTADTSSIADADGLGAFSYQWARSTDGGTTWNNIGGATASTYTLGDADVGNRIRIAVSYTDGHGTVESLISANFGPVVNVNDAPSGAVVITGSVTEDQTLTADTSSIADADGLGALSYQWTRSTDGGTTWNNIAGATASTYTLGDADVGNLVQVTVGYTDGWGSAESLTSAAAGPAANVNDAPTGAVAIGGSVTEDQTLTADTSGIADADGLGAFSYQWARSTDAGATWSNIGGATASTYTLGDADVNALIQVSVSYSDGHGSAESLTSGNVGPVADVNDAPTGAVSVTGTVTENQTLTADTSTIADADGLGAFSYQWARSMDGGTTWSNIGGASASTYTLGDADVSALIQVRVSYTDGHGTPESLTSANAGPVANVNDAPTGAVTISGTPTEDQTLTADTSSIADVDGLGVFSYQWTRSTDGGTTWNSIGGATASNYTLGDADVNALVRVGVSYTDGHGTAESLTSTGVGPVANVNDAPSGAVVITGGVTENQVLTADTASIADADGLGAFSYQWARSTDAGATWVSIGGATASTYILGDADVNALIQVSVSYTDGQGTAESLTSANVGPVTNVNDAPTGSVMITGTATEDQILTADTISIADADGLGAFSYQWARSTDGGTTWSSIGGATASTYTLGDADVNALMRVSVSYSDGHGSPESLISTGVGPVANLNDAPAGAVVITGSVTEDQTLTADTSSIADADGLGAFGYQWVRSTDGGATWSNIGGASASTYALGDADVNALIQVSVSYSDGHGTAESLTSANAGPVANVNDAPTGSVAITGTVTEDQTLTADASSIADVDGLGAFSYQWVRSTDGGTTWVNIAGASGSTYTLGDGDAGNLVRVAVSYTDGHGTAESLSSAPAGPVVNVNDAPTGAVVITGSVTEDQTLTADTSSIADADGIGALSYQWVRSTDGGASWNSIAGATASTYTLGDADVNALIQVSVAYTDGQGSAQSLTSANVGPVVNVNDAPVLTLGTLNVGQGGSVILSAANLSASDVDNTPATLTFTVSSVANGRFELSTSPGTGVTTFTQAELAAGLVVFVQDGSAAAPSYQMTVSDGALSDGPLSAGIRFTPSAPPVVLAAATPLAAVPVVTSPPPPSAPALEARSEAPAEAPARVIAAVFSPGRIDPPEAQVNDYQVQPLGLRRLIQPVASLNHFTPGPRIDPTLELLAAAPANLQYLSSQPVDWHVRSAFPDAEDTPRDRIDVLLEQVQIGGMALSVGVVWWASRVSGLLGSLLASAPAWRHIDPLPVVGRDEDEEKKWYDPEDRDAEANELAIDDVFEGARAGAGSASQEQ